MTMQEERLHETSWYIMTWLPMTRHQMTSHARTQRVIPTRRMEWHETSRKWRERLPMILAPLAHAFTGCEEPTSKGNKAITDLFLRENNIGAGGAIALVKGLKTRHEMCFLEVHTPVFFLVTVKVPHVTLTHLGFRRFVRSRRFRVRIMWTCGVKATRVIYSMS